MIPKRIITTWICDRGRDRYTERHREILEACVTSWLRVMPDYEIMFITMGNVEQFTLDAWVRACIEEGNFIGVSQWARLRALQEFGGVFLDADVEAVRPFDDMLQNDQVFTLGHLGNGQNFANNAIMASGRYHPFLDVQFDALMKVTDRSHPDFGNHTGPFMVSSLLRERGWDGIDHKVSILGNGPGEIHVRPSTAFHPYSWNQNFSKDCIKPDTLAIHHWASSWKSAKEQTTHVWRTH